MPYGNIVRNYDYKSNNEYAKPEERRVVEYTLSNLARMAWKEPERLVFERDKDEDSYAAASLDHYPDAYRLGDQELQTRYHAIKNDN